MSSRINFSQRLKNSVREGLVILVSILLAFAIDAWWDGAKTARIETAALERLYAELTEIDAELQAWVSPYERVQERTELLLSLFQDDSVESVSADSIEELIRPILSPSTFDATSSILESVGSSGLVATFGDMEFVAALSSWKATYDDFRDDERQIAHRVNNELRPFLVSRVPVRNITPYLTDRSRFEPDYAALFTDLEFENHVVWRYRGTILLINDIEKVRSELVPVMDLIADQIQH